MEQSLKADGGHTPFFPLTHSPWLDVCQCCVNDYLPNDPLT